MPYTFFPRRRKQKFPKLISLHVAYTSQIGFVPPSSNGNNYVNPLSKIFNTKQK